MPALADPALTELLAKLAGRESWELNETSATGATRADLFELDRAGLLDWSDGTPNTREAKGKPYGEWRSLSEHGGARGLIGRAQVSGFSVHVRVSAAGRAVHCPPTSVADNDNVPALMTYRTIAKRAGVNADALRKRLDAFRKNSAVGWAANPGAGGRQPGYLYDLTAVRHIVDDLKASSERPAHKIR